MTVQPPLPIDKKWRTIDRATSRGRGASDAHPKSQLERWPDLLKRLSKHEVGDKAGAYTSFGLFGNNKRNMANWTGACYWWADLDDGITLDEVQAKLAGVECLIHTTHSHTPEKHKMRVVGPLAAVWGRDSDGGPDEFKAALSALLTDLGLPHDSTGVDVARLLFDPRCPADQISEAKAIHIEGKPADLRRYKGVEVVSSDSNVVPLPVTTAPANPEFVDKSGIVHDLRPILAKYDRRFQIKDALEHRGKWKAEGKRPGKKGKATMWSGPCPNGAEHSEKRVAGASDSWVSNATESQGWDVFCHHQHCKGHDRLGMLRMMLEQEWLEPADLTDERFMLPDPNAPPIVDAETMKKIAEDVLAPIPAATPAPGNSFPASRKELPAVIVQIATVIQDRANNHLPWSMCVMAAIHLVDYVAMNDFRVLAKDTPLAKFMLTVAPTGVGKGDIRNACTAILQAAGIELDHMAAGAQSGNAVFQSLSHAQEDGKKPNMAVIEDEVGQKLAERGNRGSHKEGYLTTMMELYGMGNSTYLGMRYAEAKRSVPSVRYPYVQVFGLTTGASMSDKVTRNDADIGLLNRFMLNYDPTLSFNPKPFTRHRTSTAIPQSILDGLAAIRDMAKTDLGFSPITAEETDDLTGDYLFEDADPEAPEAPEAPAPEASVTGVSNQDTLRPRQYLFPGPRTPSGALVIDMTDAAAKRFDRYTSEIRRITADPVVDARIKTFYVRQMQHALSLAGTLAVASIKAGQKTLPVITESDAETAVAITQWSLENWLNWSKTQMKRSKDRDFIEDTDEALDVINNPQEFMAGGKYEAITRKGNTNPARAQAFAKHGYVMHTLVSNALRWRAQHLKLVIEDLIDKGLITVEIEQAKGKGTREIKLYKAV